MLHRKSSSKGESEGSLLRQPNVTREFTQKGLAGTFVGRLHCSEAHFIGNCAQGRYMEYYVDRSRGVGSVHVILCTVKYDYLQLTI